MEIRDLGLGDIKEIIPPRFGDQRGFFSETYNQSCFEKAHLPIHWVQDNHSYSAERHVLRGLHFQMNPYAQAKLVRVLIGEIYDVAVDIRKGSPTYGQWVGLFLSAEKGNQIFVPAGFAHGFLTLVPNVHIAYKVTALYAADADRSIAWNDPAIGIDWPLNGGVPHLSDKDKAAPFLADMDHNFIY